MNREKEIFEQALDLGSAQERVAFVSMSLYQGEPCSNCRDWIKAPYVLAELSELQPLTVFSAGIQDLRLDTHCSAVYDSAMSFFGPESDWYSSFGSRGDIPLADLYFYHSAHLMKYVDKGADYEIPTTCFNLEDTHPLPLLGLADDNWSDGTQSFVYNIVSPGIRDFGYGLTTTIIHEVGHHLGMSHPHDGWDSELGISGERPRPFTTSRPTCRRP